MPNITLPVRDLHFTVERPVILSIVRQLMEITHISHETQINFYGTENKALQNNSGLDKNLLVENKWPYDEKVIIEIDEDFNNERILCTPVQNPEHLFIFSDNKLGIYIKPVYSTTKVSISFKYKAKDENQARMWRNDMRTKTSMMRDINLHEVNYHYHLQEEYIKLVQELHRLRENVGGYGEDFNNYFTQCLTQNASIITDLSGTKGVWGISENQSRIQGYCDFEGAPEKGDREEEHDNWLIGFNYIFSYDKPIEVNCAYPLMIHNQLLDEKYRPEALAYTLEAEPKRYSLSNLAFAHFESDQKALKAQGNEGISIPSFDEFYPASVLPSTVKVLTVLTSIEPANKRFLFNLKELGDWNLNPEILDFLSASEYLYLGKDFRSIFTLSLYRANQLQISDSLVINANLDVMASRDLDLRQTYHVRLGLVTDYTYLPIKAIARLQNYPQAALRIIDSINSAIGPLSGHPDIRKNRLPDEEVDILLGKLAADYKRSMRMNLVQSMFVATRSMTLYEEDKDKSDYGQTN